jgi:DNA-binding transcriptional LysR family regulator
MEMHQVRYFLAVARTLNFTRAADECNVTQPSLTRAIKQLEAELGGDLFRRERPAAQLTELGLRMQPLLRQCYEAAAGARSLAMSFKSGEIGALRLALTHSVDLAMLLPHLERLRRHFNRLEFRLLRGTSREVGEYLKSGEAELGIAAALDEDWDRLDSWPLFSEPFCCVVSERNAMAGRERIEIAELASEPILLRSYCESAAQCGGALRAHNVDPDHGHAVASEADLLAMVAANLGVALVPRSATLPATVQRLALGEAEVHRTVQLYGVAGRERTAVANMVLKLLRTVDWDSRTVNA